MNRHESGTEEHTLVSLIGSVGRRQVTQPWGPVVSSWVSFRSHWGRPASFHLPLSHCCPHSASEEAGPSLHFFTGCPQFPAPSYLPHLLSPAQFHFFQRPFLTPTTYPASVFSSLFRELTTICNFTYIDLFIFIYVSPAGSSLLWYTRAVSHTHYTCIHTHMRRRGLACLVCSLRPVNNCLLNWSILSFPKEQSSFSVFPSFFQ